MKKNFIFSIIAILFSTYAYTQEASKADTVPNINANIKHNSIYLELGGNSGFYSINYDYTFSLSESTKLAAGAGLGYYKTHSYAEGPVPTIKNLFFITPEANFMFGKKSHHFETGVSLLLFQIPTLRVGYRYQPAKGGFLFRAGFTPFITGLDFTPWGGLSFGYTF